MFITRNLNLLFDREGDDDDLGGGVDATSAFAALDGDDKGDGDSAAAGGDGGKSELGDGLDDLFDGDAAGDDQGDAAGSGAAASAAGDGQTKNPSVQAVLDKVRETLPKGLHSLIIDDILAPELSKTQQGFDAQMREMEPWKVLAKNGVKPEQATEALRMASFIGQNPGQALQDVAKLAQARGLNPTEILGLQVAAAAGAAQQGDAAPTNADDALRALLGGDAAEGVDLDQNPVLKKVLEKVAGLEGALGKQAKDTAARERERQEREDHEAVAGAMERLKKGFSARGITVNENAVLQYAMAHVNKLPEAERQIDPFDALKEGARAWLADVNSAATAAARRAPRIGGGRAGLGAAGAPAKPEPPKSIEDRKAKFLEDLAAGKIVAVE